MVAVFIVLLSRNCNSRQERWVSVAVGKRNPGLQISPDLTFASALGPL